VYHDGRGLYLHVGPNGGKSWLSRYELFGSRHWMGQGEWPAISLAAAREKNLEARRFKGEGIDPLTRKRADLEAKRAALVGDRTTTITFKACAEKYIAAHQASWRNAKHASQWPSSFAAYAYPTIGNLPVSAVEFGHVTAILEPIWTTKTKTAAKVRARIEAVLDYAKTCGWRTGENPARWKGHLENVLPRPGKVAKTKHHAALDWREIGAFMTELAQQEGIGALALRFTVLTATRTSEAIRAKWSEIDLKGQVWTIPEPRMKGEKEHRVPLSDATMEILHQLLSLRDPAHGDWVFPGRRAGTPISDATMASVLERVGRTGITVHGTARSTFRVWAGERTHFAREVIEMCLAHRLGDAAEQAYARGDLFQKRRLLMAAWGEWCSNSEAEGENVIALAKAVG
jgi:integrase